MQGQEVWRLIDIYFKYTEVPLYMPSEVLCAELMSPRKVPTTYTPTWLTVPSELHALLYDPQ